MPGIRSYFPTFTSVPVGTNAEDVRAREASYPAPGAPEGAATPNKPAFGVRRFISRLRGVEKSAQNHGPSVAGRLPASHAGERMQHARGPVLAENQYRHMPVAHGRASAGGPPKLLQMVLPPFAGAQQPKRIAGTEYCRLAADVLIDADGRFDRTHLPHLLDELLEDGSKPKAEQVLGEYHREHLVATLLTLQSDDSLVRKLDRVCKRVPVHGLAADAVRSTLNLPLGHGELGKVHARKAVLMALMGNLRQAESGSCFATAPAIEIHGENPKRLVRELRSFMEKGGMRMRVGGAHVRFPLNGRCSPGAARQCLVVRADGACFSGANGARTTPHWLHEQPGMIRALNAMGCPENARHYYVSWALQQLVRKKGKDDRTPFRASPQEVITRLAYGVPANSTPDAMVRAALSAYSGTEDVSLLRAWEYTLATCTNALKSSETVDSIAVAALFGDSIPRFPHLRSPGVETGVIHARQLSSHPRFRHAPVDRIAEQLLADVRAEINRRFTFEFDPALKTDSTAGDGVSRYGGWVLCDRAASDLSSDQRSIDTAQRFKEAMSDTVASAAERTRRSLRWMRGNPKTNEHALEHLAGRLLDCVSRDDFPDQTTYRLNEHSGTGAARNRFEAPWHFRNGAPPDHLLQHYGSDGSASFYVRPPDSPNGRAEGQAQADASNLVLALCEGQLQTRPALQKKFDAMKGRSFTAPVQGPDHLFSHLPMETADLWRTGMTSSAWVRQHLHEPALQYADQPRIHPPLQGLIQTVAGEMGVDPQRTHRLLQKMMTRCTGMRHRSPEYSLRSVEALLREECQMYENADEMVDRMRSSLKRRAPPPAHMTKFLMDTNWQDTSGNPLYLAFSYDPFGQRMNVECRNRDGTFHTSPPPGLLDGYYQFHAPLSAS